MEVDIDQGDVGLLAKIAFQEIVDKVLRVVGLFEASAGGWDVEGGFVLRGESWGLIEVEKEVEQRNGFYLLLVVLGLEE